MKKTFFTLLMAFGLTVSLNAQKRECGHQAVYELNLKRDPQFLQKMQAQESAMQAWIKDNRAKNNKTSEVITVPTVIHILYLKDEQNISDEKVMTQLQVLNTDFRLQNADTASIPAPFKSLMADVGIEFCLATVDPNGNPTTGIIRHKVTSTVAPNGIRPLSVGGDTLEKMMQDYLGENQNKSRQWDISKYYNIFVAPFDPTNDLLGIASFPGSALDSVFNTIIRLDAFGTLPPLMPNFDKGRTTTHEVGHYFNLRHIWGDTLCGSDFVDDTPVQADKNSGCSIFPKISTACNQGQGNGPNGDLFVNYMDYSDDGCTVMFTQGQKERIIAAINVGRPGLLTSNACRPASRTSITVVPQFELFPNPTTSAFELFCPTQGINSVQITIYNALGQEIKSQQLYEIVNRRVNLDLNGQPAGVYSLKINSGKQFTTQKVILTGK